MTVPYKPSSTKSQRTIIGRWPSRRFSGSDACSSPG